jgi:hypothetical protein
LHLNAEHIPKVAHRVRGRPVHQLVPVYFGKALRGA